MISLTVPAGIKYFRNEKRTAGYSLHREGGMKELHSLLLCQACRCWILTHHLIEIYGSWAIHNGEWEKIQGSEALSVV
jgi:hypothetical protein